MYRYTHWNRQNRSNFINRISIALLRDVHQTATCWQFDFQEVLYVVGELGNGSISGWIKKFKLKLTKSKCYLFHSFDDIRDIKDMRWFKISDSWTGPNKIFLPFGRAAHDDETNVAEHFDQVMVFVVQTQMIQSVALQFAQKRVL